MSWQYHLVFQAGLEEKVFIGRRCNTEQITQTGTNLHSWRFARWDVAGQNHGWPHLVPVTVLLWGRSQRALWQCLLEHFCVSVQSIRQPCICHAVHGCVSCITTAERVTSVFGTAAGIVTRCPLELKLKRIPAAQPWKGKMCYRNINIELQGASEVEKAIREGEL